MDYGESNKRQKTLAHDAAASLPAWTPPPAIAAPSIRPATAASASVTSQANGKFTLTVKANPIKLRKATSGTAIPPSPYIDASESDATPVPVTRTARSTRNPRTFVEPDSDELDDLAQEDEDADGEVEDETLGQEASEDDADGDEDEEMEDMSEHPPPPTIKQVRINGKPNVMVTAPVDGPIKSVEAKEMEDDDENDELSELESEGEGNELENDDGDEDVEGETDDENMDGSRSATPDLSKLTRRQRGLYEEAATEDPSLLSLSNEAQKKKHLTAEEHAMRRQEMARRRKNLSEKRNEEEKMETINKLLSKPAPKRRTRAEILAAERADGATPRSEEGEAEKPDPLYVRWINNRQGSRIEVPNEWLEGPVGDVFKPQVQTFRAGGLIQDVS